MENKKRNYESALAQVVIAGANKEVVLDILKNTDILKKN